MKSQIREKWLARLWWGMALLTLIEGMTSSLTVDERSVGAHAEQVAPCVIRGLGAGADASPQPDAYDIESRFRHPGAC